MEPFVLLEGTEIAIPRSLDSSMGFLFCESFYSEKASFAAALMSLDPPDQ